MAALQPRRLLAMFTRAGMPGEPSPPVSYQTVRLSRGRHETPDEGACVMELASMIAGEPFSDRPRSVCPVIAAFLRAYNDTSDDERRQDLYRLAALAVGTRAGKDVELRRVKRCLGWGLAMRRARRWPRRLLAPLVVAEGPTAAEAAGAYAARAIVRPSDATHRQAIAFVEELCAMSSPPAPHPTAPARVVGRTPAAGRTPVASEWLAGERQPA
jgi:hypothetical protein